MSLPFIEYFQQQAVRNGDGTAIVCAEQSITYHSLNQTAEALARKIVSNECHKKPLVGIALGHGIDRIIAMLGILKTGLGYVLLDVSLGKQLLANLVDHSGCSMLICASAEQSRIQSFLGPGCHLISFEPCAGVVGADRGVKKWSTNPIEYIRYTSGSTGMPKGVVHSHRTALHLAYAFIDTVNLQSTDRVTLFNTFWHTLVYGVLLRGATLVLYDLAARGYSELPDWLNRNSISVFSTFPVAFRSFCSTLADDEVLESVRIVALSGEIMRTTDLDTARKFFRPDCTVVNNYGCSELAHISSISVSANDRFLEPVLPTGYTAADTRISIVDVASGSVANSGKIGEIVVYCPHITSGYWQQPRMTGSVYLQDPETGSYIGFQTGDFGWIDDQGRLVVVGRKDTQVKIRGFRVQLDEIEAVLQVHPDIEDVAVVSIADDRHHIMLSAYVKLRSNAILTRSQLVKYSKRRLPPYMVPARFTILQSLPVTAAGKIDRKALPPPAQIHPELHRHLSLPENSVEQELAVIWRDILAIEQVGLDDNFLNLGGDSLKAMLVVSRVLANFGIPLTMSSLLLETSTIAEMSEKIKSTYSA